MRAGKSIFAPPSYIGGANSPLVERTDFEGYGASDAGWFGGNIELSASAIPWPSTWAMMLLGFAGLGFAGYRRTTRRAVSIDA